MKRIIFGIQTSILVILLTGCSSLPFTKTSQQTGGNGQDFMNTDPSSMPVQMKLGIGTLKMEGSDLAVTVEQAKTLLPLWKALKILSSDTNTTAEEINALNRQIEETMTAEQIIAIKEMTWSSDDMQQLSQQYGLRAGGQSAEQAGAAGSSTRTQGGGGFPGGGPGGGGMHPGGGMMMPQGAGAQNNAAAQRTPVPGQAARREAGGMNLMFVDPVIKLLEAKIKTG